MNLKKMQNLSDKYVEKFKDAATAIVMDEVGETSDENKKVIAMFTARDMAIGSVIKRNEHILIGVGIGILGTTLALTVGCKIKNRKKKDIEEAYAEVSVSDQPEVKEEDISVMDEVQEILKKPATEEDLKAVIEELRKNEK